MGFITGVKTSVRKQMIGTTRNEDGMMEKGLLPVAVTATVGGPSSGCCEKITSAQVIPQSSCHDWKEQKCHIGVSYCWGSPLPIRLPELEASGRCISQVRNNWGPHWRSSLTPGSKTASSLASMWEKSKAVGWKTPHNFLPPPPQHIKHCTQFIRTENHMRVFHLWIR